MLYSGFTLSRSVLRYYGYLISISWLVQNQIVCNTGYIMMLKHNTNCASVNANNIVYVSVMKPHRLAAVQLQELCTTPTH